MCTGGPFEQELQIRLRPLQFRQVGVASVLLHEGVGVVAARQPHHVDVEPGLDQQLARSLGGVLAGRVGVEVDDHLGHEAVQHLRLLGGERGAAGGDHRQSAGLIQLREVEVALDHDRELGLAQIALGQVQAVEHAALGVDRRLGRVQVLRDLVRLERAPAEGDDRSGVAGDRHHQPVAEAIDDRAVVAHAHQAALADQAFGEALLRQPLAQAVA